MTNHKRCGGGLSEFKHEKKGKWWHNARIVTGNHFGTRGGGKVEGRGWRGRGVRGPLSHASWISDALHDMLIACNASLEKSHHPHQLILPLLVMVAPSDRHSSLSSAFFIQTLPATCLRPVQRYILKHLIC